MINQTNKYGNPYNLWIKSYNSENFYGYICNYDKNGEEIGYEERYGRYNQIKNKIYHLL